MRRPFETYHDGILTVQWLHDYEAKKLGLDQEDDIMVKVKDVYKQWKDGDIEAGVLIRSLASDLGEIESELDSTAKPLEREKEKIRKILFEVMQSYGTNIEIAGFGVIELIGSSSGHSYDTDAMDQIIKDLRSNGSEELAKYIEMARIETSRKEHIRITREKKNEKISTRDRK